MHVLAISDKFTNHKKKQNDSGGIAPLSFFLPRIILKMISYTNIHVLGLINNLFLRHSRKKKQRHPSTVVYSTVVLRIIIEALCEKKRNKMTP